LQHGKTNKQDNSATFSSPARAIAVTNEPSAPSAHFIRTLPRPRFSRSFCRIRHLCPPKM